MTSSHTPSPIENPSTDDEIDLRQVGGALLRHKRLIGAVAGWALVLSTLYAFTRKPVWEGQFQIVLQNNEQPSSGAAALLQTNPGLAGLIGAGGGESQLETEVKILESPSVLKPVFDFVKASKAKTGEDVSAWRYSSWVGNLTIELAKGTSVLEIAYRDTQEDLILPVIDRISKTYQAYSGRDRAKGLTQAISYLDEQIELFTTKSAESLRAAQQYAINEDLTALKGEGANDNEIKNSINIEAIRVQAANQIRSINEQLIQLNQLNDNPETLMYLGRNIPELAAQELPQTLDALDTELALLRAKFTDKDDSIRRVLEKRRLLIEVFKRQTYGYLYAQRTAAQARLKAAERPKGVLIKFRELLREAARDEATLTKLEAERQVLSLEKARKQEPWELISTPTLLDNPVAPRKKRMMALGLLAGLVAGSGAALVVDRRTGLVFSRDELKGLLPCPLLKHLSALAPNSWHDAADLLANGPLSVPAPGPIALIPVGNVPSDQLQRLRSELQQALGSRELLVSSDLRQTSRCATQLLLTAPGVATRTQLSQFKQKLALQGTPLAGWVLLDPDLELG
ncbi:capsular exopolysaccharide family domain protein [Synechococcus sp. PROS-9-1]|uniref:GumC family protein n=1 Tax=Synechococcus sp. PROS-9-1 TaxID=1968775 RepID=UPI0016442141|nr:Wzz/FepE/Etk N-terminal domain-containing protein [Synechococcus sp. PROS-9-1]QNJ30580.1 capsular exopolysaccharide family domain protein [Synechococcus sp. PROS-9-1]